MHVLTSPVHECHELHQSDVGRVGVEIQVRVCHNQPACSVRVWEDVTFS